jgi:hypothetical protein
MEMYTFFYYCSPLTPTNFVCLLDLAHLHTTKLLHSISAASCPLKTSMLRAVVMTAYCNPLTAELYIYILLHTLCKT